MSSLSPSASEIERRSQIYDLLREFVRTDQVIRIGDGRFAGRVGEFCFLFEGEDDLLHISITRSNGAVVSVEEAQEVVRFLLPELPVGVVWLKPGVFSQHFYLGHDELLSPR